MKGITHFTAGVAVASCFPTAIEEAVAGHPLYMLAGGIVALLPDTIDFKILRYLQRQEWRITPDPKQPAAATIAAGIQAAATHALSVGKRQTIKLDTIRVDTDRWQPYTVEIGSDRQSLQVSVESTVPGARPVSTAAVTLPAVVTVDYLSRIEVDILEGPTLALDPDGNSLRMRFLPWHRKSTHSLVTMLLVGLLLAVFDPLLGLIAFLAGSSHILLDQAGVMGSALYWPIDPTRRTGQRLGNSMSPRANQLTLAVSILVILWTAYLTQPWQIEGLSFPRLLFWLILAPLALHHLARRYT